MRLIKILSCRPVKAFIICIISFTIIWFGMVFGPDENSVEAKVFERLTFYTKSMPQYLFDDQITSKPRKVIVNGNTSYLTVGKSKDDISKILNFYAKRYPPQPVGKIDDAILKKVNDRKLKQCMINMNEVLECMSESQHFRMERDDFGFFGAIEFHNADLTLGSEKFAEKYENAMTTGEFGKIGTGRIVIALKNPGTQDTRIINLWTDRDFNLKNFLPDTKGDMGGKDIPGVPRYPGSRRLLAIEQENTLTYDTLVSYEGGGGVVGNILFYHSRMEDAGWKTDLIFEKVILEQSMENFMFYTRKGRECTIHIQEDENTGKIVTTITNREMKNS
ncbi:MAG: hypothetical protein KJO26_13325 [Deltaproteobacteria bacterium]|nr:hypothetical protein [Deltaproteobacteria bacterium]